jgi:hypothetical protein
MVLNKKTPQENCYSFFNGEYDLCSFVEEDKPKAFIIHNPSGKTHTFNCIHTAATIPFDESAAFYTDPKTQERTLQKMKMMKNDEYQEYGITCDMRLQNVNSYLEGIAEILDTNPDSTEVFDQLVEMDKGIGSVDYSLNGRIAGFIAKNSPTLEKNYIDFLWKKHHIDDPDKKFCNGLITDLEKFYGKSFEREIYMVKAGCLSSKKIDLYRIQLKTVPPEIGQLTAVEDIDLSVNFLDDLPPEIGQLQSLKRLDLLSNEFQQLPPVIGNLSALERLMLARNHLQTLPPEIGQLHALKQLTVSHNDLRIIPSEIGNMHSLEQLRLNDNPQLKYIPDEVGNLPNLKVLDIMNTEVLTLPDSLCKKADKLLIFSKVDIVDLCPDNFRLPKKK